MTQDIMGQEPAGSAQPKTPPELSTYASDVRNTLQTTNHTTEPNPSHVQPLTQVGACRDEFYKTFLETAPQFESQFMLNAQNKNVTICSTDFWNLWQNKIVVVKEIDTNANIDSYVQGTGHTTR